MTSSAPIKVLYQNQRTVWNAALPAASLDAVTAQVKAHLQISDDLPVSIERLDTQHDDWVELTEPAMLVAGSKLRITPVSIQPKLGRAGSMIYISHQHHRAEDLARILKLEIEQRCTDVNVFLDIEAMPECGKLHVLEFLVRSAKSVIVLVTPDALERPYVQREIRAANRFKKPIVLVHDSATELLAKPGLPREISNVFQNTVISYNRDRSNWEVFMRQLIAAVGLVDAGAKDRARKLAVLKPKKFDAASIRELRNAPTELPPLEVHEKPKRVYPKCCVCNEDLITGFLKVNEQQYHKECFKCSECQALCADEFFTRPNGSIVCPVCNAEKCTKCKKPILAGDESLVIDGKQMHSKCFTCVMCGKPAGANYFENEKNEPVCGPCMQAADGNCAICNQPLGEEPRMDVDEGEVHERCFTCAGCNAQLGENYFERDGQRFCETCANKDE